MCAQPGRYDTVPLDGVTGTLQELGSDFLSDSGGEIRIIKGSTGSLRCLIAWERTRNVYIQISVPAQSDGLQQRDEGVVRLPAHLCQLHVHVDALPPAPRLQNSERTVNGPIRIDR